jgi:DNA repair exonuclease SbcCD nuclease subunit
MLPTSIKLVHTSDVHLDSRYTSDVEGGFRNGAERAFAAVVTCTKAENADLLLIVGDLFDHNRVGESDFDFVCSQLARVTCPVVLLPGNHDVHDESSVWHRLEAAGTGGHVHALLDHDGERIELNDIGTKVWGRAMAEHAPDNVPLSDTPNRQEHAWNIGMAHGLVVSERAGYGSSQITHNEIRTSGFDYLALGHVHVWGDMSQGSTQACYPGSPVAAYASINGGHVAIVTLCPETGVDVERRQIDWREAVPDL